MTGFKEKEIVEVRCENSEMTIIYKNKKGLDSFEIPENCKNIITFSSLHKLDSYSVDFIKKMDADKPVEAEKELKESIKRLKSEIGYEFTANIPKMTYTDVTDAEMFGFPEISKIIINSQNSGLWAGHGLRKFKFVFEGLVDDDDKWNKKVSLFFDMRDNDDKNSGFQKITMEPITQTPKQTEDGKYILYGYIDTNKLGSYFLEGKQKHQFSGRIEFTFGCNISDGNEVTYSFPVQLWLNNTDSSICEKIPVLCKDIVSIDFGTSSTCVAVKGSEGQSYELMTLAANDESDGNIYENPTYIMIYRWEEIYQQWQQDNEAFPMFLKGSRKEEELGEKKVQIDFGYSVKNTLRDVDDKALNAIISEIKMMPRILHNNEQIDIVPYITDSQRKHLIHLVDTFTKQNDENLDVVALYGYILGKAINRVERNHIYTKFYITYPVKFNKEVRDKMCASLEYGLMRSVPISLRTAKTKKGKPIFKVEARYPEPVAYIGSVCGKYLKVTKDDPYKLFAVYDFGGGTLDFSFGFLKKDDKGENNIYVLNVDGDETVGGETYIRYISYWLCTTIENINTFSEKRIPFEKPKNEHVPDNFPSELFNNSVTAKSNVRKINEMVSRNIFQNISIGSSANRVGTQEKQSGNISRPGGIIRPGKTDHKEQTKTEIAEEPIKKDEISSNSNIQRGDNKLINETSNVTIELMDEQDNLVRVELSIPRQKINDLLRERIKENVEQFKVSLNESFQTNKAVLRENDIVFDDKSVIIFKAGNSSRNIILSQLMKEAFPDNEIMLVDETNKDFMSEKTGKVAEKKIKAITPKTAVSFGQLMLSNYKPALLYDNKDGNAPFSWYIYRIDGGAGELQIIIDRIKDNKNWVRYGRINSSNMRIYYAGARLTDPDDSNLKSKLLEDIEDIDDDDDESSDLYIKVKNEDTIEYCICDEDTEPSDEQAIFECRLE